MKDYTMLTNFEIAGKINGLLLEASGLLDESISVVVGGDCSDAEKSRYIEIVSQLLGVIGVDLLNEIYRIHPTLLPEGYYLPGVSKT